LEIIRDNLDLGRSDRVQLIFDRVVTEKITGEFRTRVIQDGVHLSRHINYKNFDLKQYFEEGRGCRTRNVSRTAVVVRRVVLAECDSPRANSQCRAVDAGSSSRQRRSVKTGMGPGLSRGPAKVGSNAFADTLLRSIDGGSMAG
jgi:hypothetical protein